MSMPASKISLEHAKQDKLFYFVANALIYRKSDMRFLLLKRSEHEKAHPGKYATPGGKLEWDNLDLNHPTRMNGDIIDFESQIEQLLKREIKEEAGIEVADQFHYINNVVFVRPDGIPVVLVKFAVEYTSGDVVLEDGAFTDFAWVTQEEAQQLDCIDGIASEIALTMAQLGRPQ
jgi:8-oxo-dGTP pyrophosphatase MutT (NUDIX family)